MENITPIFPMFVLNEDECFLSPWVIRRKNGYASMPGNKFSCGSSLAHRSVVEITCGVIPVNAFVLHRCGNSSCLNPYHLYVGGHEENQRDKILHRDFSHISMANEFGLFQPKKRKLSKEKSLINDFKGFSHGECFSPDWLNITYDGFLQVGSRIGYGDVNGAHRSIYYIFIGELDKYDIVSQVCGNTKCINPYHLLKSGRQPSVRNFNEKYDSRYKINDEKWLIITDQSKSIDDVASEVGLHRQYVYELRRGGDS